MTFPQLLIQENLIAFQDKEPILYSEPAAVLRNEAFFFKPP